ncbi:hypothetical protein AO946_26430 [Pseudomonas aeruginosa]|uniref:hypothetical protein n=1 Tax=Pseudomonas aeruginosa TaxID=287 RepID=UPI00071C03D1|nr:hypothetical protein [Pseudomonas aeruginosa]EKU4839425.1 hypothetical protein [Pseudomonas aeruginosa]EKW0098625.1 hypothetical protein [Pseudomonas aeruginosa]EKW6686262.1 hypothetical protein [Pseudomonas aeruginosa]EKX6190055.1 hypothetical protein [Pseudomonas aeruginosa]KSG20930.1 hypothetical protein AO946_26430 [Pseudomonas aeruginosa]
MLTDADRQWLAEHRRSVATWCDFYLAQFRGMASAELAEVAGQVLIYHKGRFVLAQDLAAEVVKSVRPSQIFEQWNYECACAVHFAAQGLSSFDAAALLVASGYQDESLDELSSASDEAVQEAWHALYGEPED